MNRTWTIEYCSISDKYMLMLWQNNKAYTLDISTELAMTLGGACTLDSFVEQHFLNENARLKSENAVLKRAIEIYRTQYNDIRCFDFDIAIRQAEKELAEESKKNEQN